jgi:hypothetical protein
MRANEAVGKTTRSGALKRLALFAGGAAGFGAIGTRALGQNHAAVPAAVPAAAGRKTKTVVLRGRDWTHVVHDAEPGKLPATTAARTPSGRIVDTRGRELGAFSAANLVGTGGALQLQTFDLVDGTILGIGAAGIHENPFAIVGGTGRYAGVSGTYVARQSPREVGGDGTAEFTLTLTA